MVNAYLDRHLEAAEHDDVMTWNFLKVTGLDTPVRALFTPHALRHIAWSPRRQRPEHVTLGAA